MRLDGFGVLLLVLFAMSVFGLGMVTRRDR